MTAGSQRDTTPDLLREQARRLLSDMAADARGDEPQLPLPPPPEGFYDGFEEGYIAGHQAALAAVPPPPVRAYALRMKSGYWVGIWNDRATAEHMRSRYREGDKYEIVECTYFPTTERAAATPPPDQNDLLGGQGGRTADPPDTQRQTLGGRERRCVVCAANRYTDADLRVWLLLGPRHWGPTMRHQAKMLPFDAHAVAWEQGFIDQRGEFLTREEAWKVAQDAEQIFQRVGGDTVNGGHLFSENLY